MLLPRLASGSPLTLKFLKYNQSYKLQALNLETHNFTETFLDHHLLANYHNYHGRTETREE